MSIAILEQGLGPVLLALAAPQPVVEQVPVPAMLASRFDLSGLSIQSSGFSLGARQHGVFPTELPLVLADDALPPPVIDWKPDTSSHLRIVPARVRYRLHF